MAMIQGSGIREEDHERIVRGFQEITESSARFVFASCWSLSEVESAAFWKLFAPPSGGVAIRSTYERLAESFSSAKKAADEETVSIPIGKVAYVDYDLIEVPAGDVFSPFLHKRRSYEFENELRAMALSLESWVEGQAPLGLEVAVDLGMLIEAIHISPSAPAWFASLVESVASHYSCDVAVVQSTLSQQPLY
ncbi:MAG TPA: hypothetical protein VFI17_13400 [Solirubrobacterales bacterium]|nr:hypothetical protein [Solirubrobacterales bacterium]